jgi:short-subunit dehydrogenase
MRCPSERARDDALVESHSRTALITGASSGIGYELARLFARDRYNLVLVARSEEGLRRVADELSRDHGVSVEVVVKDLSAPDAPQELFAALRGRTHIEVLVNNAGFATYGQPFLDTPAKTDLAMMELNMVALTQLTRLFAAEMVARRSGKILNVASTAAFQPGPLMAVYYATKSYVLSFSEALACELAPSGVGVCVLCPGPTRTGFQQRARMERSRLFDYGVMDAERVARAGYRGLMKNKTVIIPGIRNKVMAAVVRAVPRQLLPRIVLAIQKPHGARSGR